MFCGWDWGSTRHGVCLIDDNGLVVKTWMIEHTERSLSALLPNSHGWAIRVRSRSRSSGVRG